jgi:hypothetical protein
MANSQQKLVEYDYEFYENTFYNDPSVNLVTDKPLLAFHVGDYLYNEISGHFVLDKSKDEVLQVVAVQHVITGLQNIHHHLMVCVKRVPKPEALF